MNSLARVVLKKSAGLHLRRAGLEALPRAASSAPCNVPSMYVSKRYNSSVQNGDKVVEAAANAVDSTGILEQAASIVANNAAEVAVAAEHSNFVIRNVMGLIENVHNFVGIPYWEAIAVTTLGIRFLLIPVVVKTTQSTARLSHLRPTLQKISEAMKNDPRASENAVREHYQKEMQAAFLKYKVHPLHAMLWPLAQMPVFLSMFFAVQAMGTYYPGLAEGGAFWFTNLTLADPTYAFPIINALSFLAMIEMGTSDVQMEQSKTFKNVMRGLAVLTLPFTASMPQVSFSVLSTTTVRYVVTNVYAEHVHFLDNEQHVLLGSRLRHEEPWRQEVFRYPRHAHYEYSKPEDCQPRRKVARGKTRSLRINCYLSEFK